MLKMFVILWAKQSGRTPTRQSRLTRKTHFFALNRSHQERENSLFQRHGFYREKAFFYGTSLTNRTLCLELEVSAILVAKTRFYRLNVYTRA